MKSKIKYFLAKIQKIIKKKIIQIKNNMKDFLKKY